MDKFIANLQNELFKLRKRKKYLVFLILGCAVCVASGLRVLAANFFTGQLGTGNISPQALLGNLMNANLTFILLIFLYSGFWILYFQMYGTVLWYLKEYVDMTPIDNAVNSFLGIFVDNPSWKFDTEHVTVINAGVIICLQLIVSKLVQNWPALPTMIMGIGCGTLGMAILSIGGSPWIFIVGLMVFTLGEMTTHPKFLSYIGIIAPPDKKALYMGYSFLYGVIGSSIGSFLGASLYVSIVEQMGKPQLLWLIFTGIGVLSIVGLLLYNKFIAAKK